MTAPQRLAYRRLFKLQSGTLDYWEGWVEPTEDGASIILQTASTLDGAVTRRAHPAPPLDDEATPLEQAQRELERRTRKLRDKGYAEPLEATFPIVGVQRGVPQLTAQGTFEVPVWVCDAGDGKTFPCPAQGDRHTQQALWEDRQRCLGKTLTLTFYGYSEDGIPQLPEALRFGADL